MKRISFNDDIRTIFNQHCIACHGGVKQAAELSLVYGTEASYVIEPGQPDDSYLIERVTSSDPEERMPPPEHGRALTSSEIEKLRQWIIEGGQWGVHWSFVVPQKQDPPLLDKDAWSRGPVDRFVLARLRQAGLSPSEDASPERWLRRVTLDLTGLPPTLRQRSQFLAAIDSHGEAAYENVVRRLLESPAFGERWASVWLDVVRYADSKGLGLDGRRTIWKYRDWVIKAFNADMPFDDFTVKQLAGDLLPEPTIDDLVATACHRLTQTCEEGGTDDEQFRVEAVIDRVNTTMVAWQGLTFGCVQCHSHPYDPIRHEEYYQFLSFFNNSADCDLSEEVPNIRVPLEESRMNEALALDRQLDALKLADWEKASQLFAKESQWRFLTDFVAETNNSTRVVVDSVNGVSEYQTRGTVAKETTVTVESALPETMIQLTAIRFTGLPKNEPQAKINSEWGFVISHIRVELLRKDGEAVELNIESVYADEPRPLFDPMLSLNARSDNGFGAYSRIHYPRSGTFVLNEPVDIDSDSRIRVSLKQNIFATGAFPIVAHRGRFEVTDNQNISVWADSAERAERRKLIAYLEKSRRSIPSVSIPVLQERYKPFVRPSFVFDRGNYLTKTEQVSSRTPSFLPPLNQDAPSRLDLARWVASTGNPLTGRVAVNRFWAQLFGVGLVETQEDFGSSGEPPSHPLLLDDLAVRFATDMNWSVKSLLRELVLSSTYRQSSAISADRLKMDPRNRLLSRGPRHRLPAETIRDQALFIAGLLSEKHFGEPVHPPIPDGVWMPFQGSDKWSTPEKGDPDRYRRTVYTYTKRTIQFPLLASFDAPTREFCAPRRLPSNTPLQALMTLNDATFVEASEALAGRMSAQSGQIRQQLRHGFLLAACRAPTRKELDQLLVLYKSSLQNNSDEASKLASLQTVASVLLNLDEVMNK